MAAKKNPGAEAAPAIPDTTELPPAANEPVIQESEEITAPKKRGRKSNAEREALGLANKVTGAGSTRSHKKDGKKSVYSKDSEEKLAAQIQGIHAIGSMISGIPELAIGEKEAEMLASAVMAVAAEYNLELSGKTGAAIQLLAACAAIYVPRLIMVKQRVAKQQAITNVIGPDAVN